MNKFKRIDFLFSPLHLFGITNLLIIVPFFTSPDVEILGQRYWYISSGYFPIIATGLLGTYTGLIIARVMRFSSVTPAKYELSVSDLSMTLVMDKFAKITFVIALLGYLVWIATDFRGWTSINNLSHLETIPGLTTLTQFMPISLATFYFLFRAQYNSKLVKIAIPMGLVLTFIRSFVNHERLALLECIVPIAVVFFLTQHRILRFRLHRLYIGSLFGIYILFSASEYFRSWQYYRNTIDESFFVFSFFRLINYYSTALNNGAVYLELHNQISSLPIYSANFVWNFPILGTYLQDLMEKVQTNLTWSQVLKSTMGTDEFNNISPYFLVVGELGIVGAYCVFTALGYVVSRLHKTIISQRSTTIPIYACWVIGILELPRIFWFGSGRALPTILASLYLLRKLNSVIELPAIKRIEY